MTNTHNGHYIPRATFIDGLAVAEEAAYDKADAEHLEFCEANRDLLEDNYIERAQAREEALCLAEIESGKVDSKRKNQVLKAQEDRPRAMATARMLKARLAEADGKVYAAVRREAPGAVAGAHEDVRTARNALQEAMTAVEAAKANVQRATTRMGAIERIVTPVGAPAGNVWAIVNSGTTDLEMLRALDEILHTREATPETLDFEDKKSVGSLRS